MERREPPPTAEGWYAVHDFRAVDWDAWRALDGEGRERVIRDGEVFLREASEIEDADAGVSVAYGVLGHKADLLVLHLRPTLGAVHALERSFEETALAEVTDRVHSYVSVTEVSGYAAREYFEADEEEVEVDPGLENYIQTRLYPRVPDARYVCFYPMSKRRDPEYNWYALSFEERAAYMEGHGEVGRSYAGEVTQMITGSIGFDDWEWGVTLWANDPTVFKRLLYEMRFDPSTSRYAEFGSFFVGERLAPDALERFFAGEDLGEAAGEGHGESGRVTPGETGGELRDRLAEHGVYAGQPHGEDVYALVLYSEADPGELAAAVSGLRGNFEHYDTHVSTGVYDAVRGALTAVVSLWETERAAGIAGGFLSDLPGVIDRADEEAGWGTMGMFYAVRPEYREEFVDTFADVVSVLAGMDGHRETVLLANTADENDMFIASQWRSREDALEFFRSEAFRDTVEWGREVLAGRPRHVFLS